MRILILGSGSFAGQAIFSEFLKEGLEVYGINRSGIKDNNQWEWLRQFKKDINWYELNIYKESEKFVNLIKGIKPTHIIDFMGQGMVAQSWSDPRLWYTTNISEKAFVLENIRQLKSLEKYVRASTPEVYGSSDKFISESQNFNPSTPYAVSHSAIDFHIRCLGRQFNFPYSIGRFANFYGEGQQLYRVIPRAILSCLTKRKFILDGEGKSTRYFIHSDDIISSIKLLLFTTKTQTEYNFSGAEEVSINNLIRLICTVSSTKFDDIVNYGPERPGKDLHYRLNCLKAKNDLDWSPKVKLEDGISRVVKWIERNLEALEKASWVYEHKD